MRSGLQDVLIHLMAKRRRAAILKQGHRYGVHITCLVKIAAWALSTRVCHPHGWRSAAVGAVEAAQYGVQVLCAAPHREHRPGAGRRDVQSPLQGAAAARSPEPRCSRPCGAWRRRARDRRPSAALRASAAPAPRGPATAAARWIPRRRRPCRPAVWTRGAHPHPVLSRLDVAVLCCGTRAAPPRRFPHPPAGRDHQLNTS